MTPEEMLLSLPDLSLEAAQDYLEYRKKSKKNPLNRTAWTAICKEIFKSGWQPDDALAEAMNREWRGLKAIWLAKIQNDEMVMMQQIKNHPDKRGFIEKHTDTSWHDDI
jgi:hypothetical protein